MQLPRLSPRRSKAALAVLCLMSVSVLLLHLLRLTPEQREVRNRIKYLKPFEPVLSRSERLIVLDLLVTIDRIFKHYNVTYFMYGGTLLGSYRHLGLIPWDDDIDVFVNVTCRERLPDMLSHLAPSLRLHRTRDIDKVSHGLSSRICRPWKCRWDWPYLDISYFEENRTHIWDLGHAYRRTYLFPKYLALPMHLRPLEDLWLPAPRDTLAFLQLTYGQTSTCVTPPFSHMLHEDAVSHRWPCRKLRDRVAFVHRRPCSTVAGNGSSSGDACVQETLRLGPVMLRSAPVPEPAFAINDPFSLRLMDGFSQPAHYPNTDIGEIM